jgi:methionyl-tRNA formyltransferase
MGTPDFAVPSLAILLDAGCTMAGVVTAPDKPRGRGLRFLPTPVKELALRHGLPVLQPERLKEPGFLADLTALRPEIIVVVAFRILPPEVYSLAPAGAFNLHASLLPKYRGAAPIARALMNGETETGVTTFLLQPAVDTGGILLSEPVAVLPDDDAGMLHDRLAATGARLVLDTVRILESGNARPRPQDDAQATPAPKIFRDDCRIRWSDTAAAVRNRVRALAPAPGAFTMHGDRILKIYRVDVLERMPTRPPGSVRLDGGALLVSAADGMVVLQEVQQEGKRRMSAGEFLRGYPLGDGDILT